ncbi:anthranilate phosphoribosyltransferase [Paenibacillus agricola]|uniref:Anthranilate phosphoribosyltransferase n=1 Tax=Paenibacillus agricola TaxID=2716264 RepID=A0ABX0J197_9BACL|nr:anthranilate phosphoribosyltransferase [Paenibacillus agricola]NHN30082.1 anthranilate phosphoribosyltransferase [Paenibacillus agricola]
MKQWIKVIGAGKTGSRDLTYDEAVAVAHTIARGESTDTQTATFLTAMRMKGEADEEMMGFIDVFRKYSLPYRSFSNSLNCAGPYEGRHYFPVTIPVSLLIASVGFPQVLHGSESFPLQTGVSLKELLEGLGIEMDIETKEWEKNFLGVNIGFIWTDQICPPFAHVRQVREQMGLGTFFNTVEKVINPVHSHNMIIGVSQKTMMDHLIQLLPRSGFDTAYIVQGIDGSEDLPIYKSSSIRKVTPWGDESNSIDPLTFGFRGEPLEKCGKDEQIRLLQRVIEGDDSDEIHNEREHVVFNAGLRLYWFDKVGSYEEGFQLARSLLQRKEAFKILEKWRDLSKRSELRPSK